MLRLFVSFVLLITKQNLIQK